jgi:polysaccharide export outer membrane protein
MRIVRLLVALSFVLALLDVAGAQTDGYRIGPDDILAISVWDNKDVDHVVFVRPDGKISLPLLGEVQAGGLTVEELITQLNQGYGRTIKGAQATVIVREIRSRPVFFVGGVGKPGPMQLTQHLTLLQAASLAGGLNQAADQEGAFVLRAGKMIPVNFVRLMKGDVSQNILLEPGDTIVVPIADTVYVQGEVKKPGTIKFTTDLTMVKAISEAGGFTDLAAPKRVTVLRGDAAKKQNMRVNVDQMITDPQSAPDLPLRPNDVIIVPQRLF